MTLYEWGRIKFPKTITKKHQSATDMVIISIAKVIFDEGEFGDDMAEIETMVIRMYEEDTGSKYN